MDSLIEEVKDLKKAVQAQSSSSSTIDGDDEQENLIIAMLPIAEAEQFKEFDLKLGASASLRRSVVI